MTIPSGPRIVLASGNKGKVRELQALLSVHEIQILPQSDFGVPDAAETGLSFVENAIIKARNASRHSGLPAIADDSGLEVDYLNGAPGIYSARYAGPQCSDADNNAKLLAALQGVSDAQRAARFQCVLVYMRHAEDPTPLICQGSWEGRILTAPLGDNGFGYDPLFWVESEQASSAQLSPQRKNQLSHRGQALRALLRSLEP
jgi:XTP/dITP diphosphohydrolase